MCTGFAIRGRDVICGFNLDLMDGLWRWEVHAEPEAFYVGLRITEDSALSEALRPLSHRLRLTNGLRRICGVTRSGSFGALLVNIDAEHGAFRTDGDILLLDQLADDYLSDLCAFDELAKAFCSRDVVNLPGQSLHALFADAQGRFLIAEPGVGCAVIRDRLAVCSNFSLLDPPREMRSYYGKDRYDAAVRSLRSRGDEFSAQDGLALLRAVRQTEGWATRVSFVYSRNENAVYYALEGDFDHITRHAFA